MQLDFAYYLKTMYVPKRMTALFPPTSFPPKRKNVR